MTLAKLLDGTMWVGRTPSQRERERETGGFERENKTKARAGEGKEEEEENERVGARVTRGSLRFIYLSGGDGKYSRARRALC